MESKFEYDLYLPLCVESDEMVDPEIIREVKKILTDRHGGVTDFKHRNEGQWKVGGVTYRDEIIILRVLAASEQESDEFFGQLKKRLEKQLMQDVVLVVKRKVETL